MNTATRLMNMIRRALCAALVLTATALFGSYTDAVRTALEAAGEAVDTVSYEIVSPATLVGVLLGAAVVFLFSGLAINAVGRAAGAETKDLPAAWHRRGDPHDEAHAAPYRRRERLPPARA